MPAKGVFVDDEDKQYAALLSTRGVLEFEYQSVLPLTDQALAIKAVHPTIIALDYRLDEVTPDVAAGHTYKGSGLAQVLRDDAIASPAADFAIVLVSNEVKLEALYTPDKTAHDLFDIVYSKEALTQKRDVIRGEVRALSEGYEYLRGLNQSYDPIVILGAVEGDRDRLSVQEITTAFARASAPHIVSKMVLRNFIERSGLLIDDADGAAVLGLDPASFATMTAILVEAGLDYRGLFSGGWRRWWTHRVEEWAESRLGQPLLSMNASERAEHLSRSLNISLQPAHSPWNESVTEYIGFACASCRRPTEMRHSLAAFDPKAPKFATRRRICWDCIQTDQYLEPPARLLVEETDESLIKDIKKRDRNT